MSTQKNYFHTEKFDEEMANWENDIYHHEGLDTGN